MKRDKYTTKPFETSVEACMPEDTLHRFTLNLNTMPVPRLHNITIAGQPDSYVIVAAPGDGELEFVVDVFARDGGEGTADVDVRAWYAETMEPIPNDILSEPPWLDLIEQGITEYLRERYESNCDPDEWVRGQ